MKILICAALLAIPSLAQSRGQQPLAGSSIALEYTVEHDVLRPGEDVALLACLTNQNIHSSRSIQPGDSFAFDFTRGTLRGIGDVVVHSPSGAFGDADFRSSMDGNVLTLEFVGAMVDWPVGDAACVPLRFTAPERPMTVMTSYDISNEGAFAPPSPAAVLLNVAADLGLRGPEGPSGPQGPRGETGLQGVPGASGAGARAFAVTSDITFAIDNEPPVPLPGLDVTLTVAGGSSLQVIVDALTSTFPECNAATASLPDQPSRLPNLLMEVDGVLVAFRSGEGLYPRFGAYAMAWQSGPLAAGPHRVRALLEAEPQSAAHRTPSLCMGSAIRPQDQVRMSVFELRAP